jgi:hypothetical protein
MDINLDKELVDYEPSHHASNHGSISSPPDGWPRREQHRPSQPASDGPQQLRRTSRAIADTLHDISTGTAVGEHPALDKLIGPAPGITTPASPRHEHRRRFAGSPACGPGCGEEVGPQHRPHESAATAFSRRPLIADVRPPVKERLAVVEHRVDDLDSLYGNLQELALLAAPKADVQADVHALDKEMNRRFSNVYKQIDTEIKPEIKDLKRKRVFRDWVLLIGATISIAYNIFMFAKNSL